MLEVYCKRCKKPTRVWVGYYNVMMAHDIIEVSDAHAIETEEGDMFCNHAFTVDFSCKEYGLIHRDAEDSIIDSEQKFIDFVKTQRGEH